MKKYNIIFWSTAGLLFLTQGIMPILTFNQEGSREAIAHLGYPAYFGAMLAVFKLLGGLTIIIPKLPHRFKEWAFAGFGIDFICAFISFIAVDGLTGFVLLPAVACIILALCYYAYTKRSGH